VREIKHLSVHQWLRSVIPDPQQPTSPIGFLFLKLPPPPCAVLLVVVNHDEEWFIIIVKSTEVLVNHPIGVLSINLNGHFNK
jgi:hypothetical protein